MTATFCAQTVEDLRTLRCRRCGAPLGWTTATALVLAGGMRVLARTTLVCAVCGRARVWRPLEEAAGGCFGGPRHDNGTTD